MCSHGTPRYSIDTPFPHEPQDAILDPVIDDPRPRRGQRRMLPGRQKDRPRPEFLLERPDEFIEERFVRMAIFRRTGDEYGLGPEFVLKELGRQTADMGLIVYDKDLPFAIVQGSIPLWVF